jgi:hypothetical protein
MKISLKILLIVFITAWWGCEKNDPLADQGTLTGNMVPFNLLAQMPDAAAGDTLTLRNVSWAVDDNIGRIDFIHSGFKSRIFDMSISIEIAGESNTIHQLAATYLQDTIHFEPQIFASYPESGEDLNQYFQTLENAYVILHPFIVPAQYKLSKTSNEELVREMDEDVFSWFVDTFSVSIDREVMIALFPDINPFSVQLFKFDDNGNFTGELTENGLTYFFENFTRELAINYLDEANVSDNTRVTIETEAVLDGNDVGAVSTRVFKII